ncbi:MAG: hypothetical protein JSV87_05100 [Candidatus Bathyarchaeota archaeon]|nr:MAG: hypothetical protein JSV87_05100 [Candidatus Bathyarchaeota archaeon]
MNKSVSRRDNVKRRFRWYIARFGRIKRQEAAFKPAAVTAMSANTMD